MEPISDIACEDTTKRTMASLGLMCEKEMDEQRRQIDSFIASPFQRSMDSLLERAQATAQSQVELANMKADLREAEDELVKVLAVKTRKEARQMGLRDSISATQSRIQVLRSTLHLQKSKREEYAKIISQKLQALTVSEDNAGKVTEDKADIYKAISWYNQALGFHVEAGHGVKFTFTNIDAKRPTREYSFTVRYENDIYTLLDCNPQMDHIEEMVQELNKTNDLFRFVRLMRDKFLKATLSELPIHTENLQEETSILSASAPAISFSTDTNMSTPDNKGAKVQANRRHKRSNDSPLPSHVPTRRSSRLKVLDTNMSTPDNKGSNVQANRRHKRSNDSPLPSPVPTSSVRLSSRLKVLDTNMSTPDNKGSKVQENRRHKRSNDSPLPSPVPTSSARRSSCLKAKK